MDRVELVDKRTSMVVLLAYKDVLDLELVIVRLVIGKVVTAKIDGLSSSNRE